MILFLHYLQPCLYQQIKESSHIDTHEGENIFVHLKIIGGTESWLKSSMLNEYSRVEILQVW